MIFLSRVYFGAPIFSLAFLVLVAIESCLSALFHSTSSPLRHLSQHLSHFHMRIIYTGFVEIITLAILIHGKRAVLSEFSTPIQGCNSFIPLHCA